jgi:hypothetical protein
MSDLRLTAYQDQPSPNLVVVKMIWLMQVEGFLEGKQDT